ncbi:GGDEF domain-containing response regulator [Geitlerinema sp. PCC 7407]|uniref:EAL domain-containing response regulator n=1 Tax=Geitlerinema sp. PCC 7407 TaxID=1173025 RepID=UPI00029FE553|nr:GGDEF domain-containing response regulator [Geitlerinema sp. PCC 7407]AFY67345.1 response regulator receiver modulated diguanylate cyclase/phosphodiesterase [Geitlerinema sp. PCC 7407]
MTKILVIEDEQDVRDNVLELLEAEGFDVLGAANGQMGVQIAFQESPDLILCDVIMPHLDGYGVLEVLRRNASTATIPFIFMTAKADMADLRLGMELGADDYLTKPCTPKELLRAIAVRLRKQEMLAERYGTQLRQAEERLNHLVYYDSLTNLPNRLLLQEHFEQVASPLCDQRIGIMVIGLDRLSRINETLGHSCGDLLIKAVGDRLASHLESSAILGHLTADKFAILLQRDRPSTEALAKDLVDATAKPFFIGNRELFITSSIGIAFYSQHGAQLDNLIQCANAAMNQVKQRGGDGWEIYQPGMNARSFSDFMLETDLRYALERDQFEVYYQPRVNLRTGQVVGAEALLRWPHPDYGFVSPTQFIPLAEANGLIVPIGEWVLQTVCQQARRWQDAGYPPLQLAVNLSGRQLSEAGLCQRIDHIIRQADIAPEYLELELTESIIVQDVEATLAKLNQLTDLGLQISIDDFGTGYSSLNYLKEFSFHCLKIDRCFVRGIASDSKNSAIAIAIIQMAHGLDLRVVAEGVETEAERAFLHQHHCDEMQGYLVSKPLSAEQFETAFRKMHLMHEAS